jgi:hypothetical protein
MGFIGFMSFKFIQEKIPMKNKAFALIVILMVLSIIIACNNGTTDDDAIAANDSRLVGAAVSISGKMNIFGLENILIDDTEYAYNTSDKKTLKISSLGISYPYELSGDSMLVTTETGAATCEVKNSAMISEINKQVYNRDESEFTGSGTIKIKIPGTSPTSFISAGSVDNGKLNLDLPKEVADSELKNRDGILALGAEFFLFDKTDQSNCLGQIDLDFRTGTKLEYITFIYFKEAIFAMKSEKAPSDGVEYQVKTEYCMRQGWNRSCQKIDHSSKTILTTTDPVKMPTNFKWHFYEGYQP